MYSSVSGYRLVCLGSRVITFYVIGNGSVFSEKGQNGVLLERKWKHVSYVKNADGSGV